MSFLKFTAIISKILLGLITVSLFSFVVKSIFNNLFSTLSDAVISMLVIGMLIVISVISLTGFYLVGDIIYQVNKKEIIKE